MNHAGMVADRTLICFMFATIRDQMQDYGYRGSCSHWNNFFQTLLTNLQHFSGRVLEKTKFNGNVQRRPLYGRLIRILVAFLD
jgi:hypothetical protein